MKAMRHVGIVVANMDKALGFYRDLLGMKIKRDMLESGDFIDNILALKNVKVRTVKLSMSDGNLIELLHYESHPSHPVDRKICDLGYTHVAFTVDNLDSEYERLKKTGVEFVSAPRTSPDGGAKVVFCRDPEGNQIELVEELKR